MGARGRPFASLGRMPWRSQRRVGALASAPSRLLVRFHEVDKLLLLVHVELAVDVFDVRARRAFRNLQVAGDDGQRASVSEKHDHLALARRQPEIVRDSCAVLFKTTAASIRDGGGGVSSP